MRFEFYNEGLADVPKLSVDGTVGNAVHLSHWQGNETPAHLRADTSTEIALNFVAAPDREELARGFAGRHAAAALFDELDETIEGVDRQLHETNATRTYVRMRSAAGRNGRPEARYSRSSPGLRR